MWKKCFGIIVCNSEFDMFLLLYSGFWVSMIVEKCICFYCFFFEGGEGLLKYLCCIYGGVNIWIV